MEIMLVDFFSYLKELSLKDQIKKFEDLSNNKVPNNIIFNNVILFLRKT